MEPSPNMVICESQEETLWPLSVWHVCSIVNWMLASILSWDAEVKGLLLTVLFKHMSRYLRNQQGATGHILAMTRSGTTVWPCQTIYWPIPTVSMIKKILPLYVKERSTVNFLSKFKRLLRASCDIWNCQTAWLHHTTSLNLGRVAVQTSGGFSRNPQSCRPWLFTFYCQILEISIGIVKTILYWPARKFHKGTDHLER